MCGIWGIVNCADEEMAERAAEAMKHRGPDDHGVFVAQEPLPISLVNTRLSIIDLSDAGHQPMCTQDGRYWIAYNGEVYNYQPLRQMLSELGHHFNSNTDTEVILNAYAEWGPNCLEYLRGMFAFAIWDMQEAKLFAARDRLGVKPLYYTVLVNRADSMANQLIFGSELKTLLSTGLVERRLNYAALHHYLSFYSVPTPYTMLADVMALPAGHYLTFQDGKLTIKRYWSIPPAEDMGMSEADIVRRLRQLLEDAIKLRMIADVPVGAFLSGGVDSSAMVALMTRASGEKLRTFSIGFGQEGANIDERSQARVLADHYGTEHTEVVVSGHDVRNQIDDIIRAMDQPSGDGLNTYLVSQATAQHVKVALSGLGGDELFAGYPQFKLFEQIDRAARVWNFIPGFAQQMAKGVGNVVDPLGRAIHWLDGDILARYGRVRMLYDETAKLGMYTQTATAAIAAPEPSLQYLARYLHPTEKGSGVQLTRLELKNYMAHTLLRDTDAMSMAHSLEVRVPLIDHKLVEFAVSIPAHLKLKNGRGKYIFAKALEDILPAQILDRPKRGFEMPVAAWLQNELRDVMEDVFSIDSLNRRGIFKPDVARTAYDNFLSGKGVYMHAWSLAVVELWCRAFIDA